MVLFTLHYIYFDVFVYVYFYARVARWAQDGQAGKQDAERFHDALEWQQ